ncbi:hypothetical protein MRX96_021622 [Rhipicephalus microplus]
MRDGRPVLLSAVPTSSTPPSGFPRETATSCCAHLPVSEKRMLALAVALRASLVGHFESHGSPSAPVVVRPGKEIHHCAACSHSPVLNINVAAGMKEKERTIDRKFWREDTRVSSSALPADSGSLILNNRGRFLVHVGVAAAVWADVYDDAL